MALPAFAFDTHKFVRKLKGAGFNEAQAEALTDAVQESQASLNVATTQDVVEVGRDMEQGFADVRHEIGDLRRDLADAEERTDAKLDKLGAELRHEISDLHKDNESLRKDMDAKFTGVDAKLSAMEERSDAKHESLRKDMDAKHESLRKDNESLRKDMDAKHESLRKDMDAKLDKLGLQLTVRLGLISAAFFTLGPSISKFLHLST